MLKTLASLALLLACIANVHAEIAKPPGKFPPCDGQSIDFVPLAQMTASPFIVGHSYVGEESRKIGNIISNGHCTVFIDPPFGAHQGITNIDLAPSYDGSVASYGVAVLPEWPTVASPRQEVAYTLSFDMSSATPAKDDWLDLVQLDFKRSNPISSNAGYSTVYRLRKTYGYNNTAIVTLIESRLVVSASTGKAAPADRVVATLTANSYGGISSQYIALRWTQKVVPYTGPLLGEGETPAPTVNTRMQLLDSNGTPLYTTTLTNEFANSFSMGLLNHNTIAMAYPTHSIIEFSNATLSAQSIP
jgi:hypothetical protein